MFKVELKKTVPVKISQGFFENILKKISPEISIKNGLISLALAGEKKIKMLNKIYRGKDKITDVLSFSWKENDFLGEIVICYPVAKKQAQSFGHSVKKELEILFRHGFLHLIGYTHQGMKKSFPEFFK